MNATAHLAVMRTSIGQRGAASVGIAILMILLMGAAVSTALSLSGSVARDAASADQQVQALFIAETGMERAAQRFVAGGLACGALGETISMGAAGSFTIGAGANTMFDGVTPSTPSCRIRVTGRTAAGQVVRVIESVVAPTTNSFVNQNFECTVPTGADLMLLLTVSWATHGIPPVSITRVTFNGAAMTRVGALDPVRNSDGSEIISAQDFYLRAPTVGTKIGGTITMSADPGGLIIVGCHVLAGVDPANLMGSFGVASALSPNPAKVAGKGVPFHVAIASGAVNPSWFIIDNLARENTGTVDTGDSAISHPISFETNANGIASARSSLGPIAAATSPTMEWTWNQPAKKYVLVAVAIPASAILSQSAAKVDASPAAGGIRAWREVTVPPI